LRDALNVRPLSTRNFEGRRFEGASDGIALIGYMRPEDERRSRESGFDHYIAKPADPDRIIALLDTYRRTD
jgi:CheY-like chemotaxis protein